MNPRVTMRVGQIWGMRVMVASLAPVQQGDARNRMWRWRCVSCPHEGVCSAYNIRSAAAKRSACRGCGRKNAPVSLGHESTDARGHRNEIARRSAAKRRRERGEELRSYDRDLKRRKRAEQRAARA